jgi:hypothetical protein
MAAAYPNLSPADAQQLAELGVLVPPPGMVHSELQSGEVSLPDFNLDCMICQFQLWVMLGLIVGITAPYLPAWAAYVGTGAAAVGYLVAAISRALDKDAVKAREILDTIAILIDPTAWPHAICRLEGLCS